MTRTFVSRDMPKIDFRSSVNVEMDKQQFRKWKLRCELTETGSCIIRWYEERNPLEVVKMVQYKLMASWLGVRGS